MTKYESLIEILKKVNIAEIPNQYGVSTKRLPESYKPVAITIDGERVYVSTNRNRETRVRILEKINLATEKNIAAVM